MIKLEQQTEILFYGVSLLTLIYAIYLTVKYLSQKDQHQADLFDLHNKYSDELQTAKKDLKEVKFQAGVFAGQVRMLKALVNAYKPVKTTEKPDDVVMVIRADDTILLQVDDCYSKPRKTIEIVFHGVENLYYFANLYREFGCSVEVFDATTKKTIINDKESGQC